MRQARQDKYLTYVFYVRYTHCQQVYPQFVSFRKVELAQNSAKVSY